MTRTPVVLVGVLAALAVATPATAQVTLGADAATFSNYVWRGTTLTNKPVFQPGVYLTLPLGKASLTAGGWASVDLGKYDGTEDLSESGGASSFNVAEFDWWGEIGVPLSVATLTAGVTGYRYPNSVGLTGALNTVELYGKVALSTPLSPQVSAYYDVDKVKGLYIEGGVSHGFALGLKKLTLGALAGWTGGQEVNPREPDELYNFADNGITHIDLSASMALSAGSLSITPSIHGVFGQDDATRVTQPTALDTAFKVWGGVTISWSKELGAAKESEERE